MMNKIRWSKLAVLFIAVLTSLFSLALGNETVFADGEKAGYFNIYAYYESVRYDDYGNEVPGSYIHKITSSAKVTVNGDGTYSVDEEQHSDVIKVSVSRGKLRIEPACAFFNTCPGAVTVDLSNNVDDVRNAVNGKLAGTTWNTSQTPIGGGTSVVESYYFSTSDVTDIEKVEAPADALGTEVEPGSVEQNCVNADGAGSLGWIVCPIMTWLGDAADDAYTKYVEPSLQVDPQLFTTGGDDGVRGGWDTFRNIANVLFIILFLVVIFSQLTGVGIDNYGIKKILPKIIVAAILINLSYWICLVFVDLSNILGNAFQAMFNGLGSNLGELKLDFAKGSSTNGASIAPTAVTGVAVLGALVIATGALWTNPAIILSLFVSALGVAIAVFFLFILLAAREAAIIVLVVLSPLAVACYMLPNTKNLFDKWLKLFEGLLLVYPICGLLVGGGNYISKLLLSAGFGTADSGFLRAFTAMIVGIVPIFFIPTVLKQSFAAMGNLGAKISGIGQKVGSGLTGAARNSQAYKNAQERGLERRARIQAGVDADGNPIEMGRLRRAMRGGKRNIARNRAQYRKNQAEIDNRNRMMNDDMYAGLLASDRDTQEMQDEMARIKYSGEINDMGAIQVDANGNYASGTGMAEGLYRALKANDSVKIRAYTDALSAQGEDGRNAVKSAWNAAVGNQNNGISAEAAKTFGDNLMASHAADYKSDARSMFNTAAKAKSGNIQQTTAVGAAELAASAKSSTMVSMDDTEFAQTFGDYVNNANGAWDNLDANTKHTIQYQAYQAIQNNPNMKGDRFAGVSALARGYIPGEGEVLQVRTAPPQPNP